MAFLKHIHLLRDLNKIYNINSKKGTSEKVNDHRPINLCNVFYKFLYKVLAN